MNFSPTTEPIEPPMNLKSKAQAVSGSSIKAPRMTTIASFSPVAFCAATMRSL